MHTSRNAGDLPCFEVKGNVLTALVLHVLRDDWQCFARQLDDKIQQAPEFFRNVPVLIDLQSFQAEGRPDFACLKQLLLDKALVPVGVRNGSAQQHAEAAACGLGVLAESRQRTARPLKTDTGAAGSSGASKIVTQPVRSGQQIYARGGDLVVLSTVSPGAEIIADGHIHIYGTLRGRALAGVQGDERARIFCQRLEAEIISIAGHYRVMEEIDEQLRGRPAQVYLREDSLKIETL